MIGLGRLVGWAAFIVVGGYQSKAGQQSLPRLRSRIPWFTCGVLNRRSSGTRSKIGATAASASISCGSISGS